MEFGCHQFVRGSLFSESDSDGLVVGNQLYDPDELYPIVCNRKYIYIYIPPHLVRGCRLSLARVCVDVWWIPVGPELRMSMASELRIVWIVSFIMWYTCVVSP